MPKDEFDFDDPMELNGVGLGCAEDTTAAMTECFVEEFMRLGYDHRQILALFRNPHYIGMNLALQNHGEPFVRDMIGEVFARRGKTATWPVVPDSRCETVRRPPASTVSEREPGFPPAAVANQRDAAFTDPMGAPAPKISS